MRLMGHALVELCLKGDISGKTLLEYCNDRTEVEKLCGEIRICLPENEPSFLTLPNEEENSAVQKEKVSNLS